MGKRSVAAAPAAFAASAGQIEWAFGGQGAANTRNQPDQTKLNVTNASQLAVKWTATLHGDISATPSVMGGVVYVPEWGVQVNGVPAAGSAGGGYLNAINESTGSILWSKKLADYPGEVVGAVSRTSPAVVDGVIYIGDQTGNVLAIDAKTGALNWMTNIDPTQPAGLALVTQSPMVYGGVVFVGTGSNQEGAAADRNYPCCTHRGSLSALNATTGAILWTFYTEPPNAGPAPQDAGGGVWGQQSGRGVRGCGRLPRFDHRPRHGDRKAQVDYGPAVAHGDRPQEREEVQRCGYWRKEWRLLAAGRHHRTGQVGDPSRLRIIARWHRVGLLNRRATHLCRQQRRRPAGLRRPLHGSRSNAATGQVLWSYKGAGSSNAGPAIGLDGTVYWGNGYSHFGLGAASTKFYAFSVNGK